MTKDLKAALWRTLLGPAMIVDGLFMTITLGFWSTEFSLKAAKRVARILFAVRKEQP